MRKTFVALDVNGDGMLSLEEVPVAHTDSSSGPWILHARTVLGSVQPLRHTHHAGIIKQVFDSIDTNSSGSICIAEIREAIQSTWSSEGGAGLEAVPQLHSWLKVEDQLQLSGTSNAGKQLEVTQAELDEVIQEIDVNGDGEIDLEDTTMQSACVTRLQYKLRRHRIVTHCDMIARSSRT
eukprot:607375-Amphidinium_carterae.1